MIQKRWLHFLYEPVTKIWINAFMRQTKSVYSFTNYWNRQFYHLLFTSARVCLCYRRLLICCHRHVVDVWMLPSIVLLGFCSVRLLDYEGMLPICDEVICVQLIFICVKPYSLKWRTFLMTSLITCIAFFVSLIWYTTLSSTYSLLQYFTESITNAPIACKYDSVLTFHPAEI